MKTKLLSLLLTIIMLSTVFTVGVTAESQTDVPEGYVGVYTKDDLFAVRENPSGKYILMNDIVFDDADYVNGGDFYNSGKGWEPIGTKSTPFKGTFDGNGYNIVNLQINNPDGDYQGLFGYTSSATIKGINLKTAYIIGADYTGGIVGFSDVATSSRTLSNCSSDGHISGKSYVSGIVGYQDSTASEKTNAYSYINTCINSAKVSGENYVGGITGFSTASYYSNSYGSRYEYSYIQRCVNSGTIICTGSYAGGIVGYASSSSNSNSGSYAPVFIQNCYNTGSISANDYAGGISGKSSSYNQTKYSYSIGVVYAETNFGGCFGNAPREIVFCYYLEDAVSEPDCLAGTPKSPDQLKKQGTFEQWDFDTVWTMEGREDFPYPELRDVPLVFPEDSKTEISGTVTVTGEAKVGSTLTAEITDISPADATFEYEWKADGIVVGTDATYTVTQDDVGKNITLTVKGNGNYKGIFTSSAIIGECVHSVSEYTNNNNATCEKNETKSGICEKCKAPVTEEIEDTKLPHTFITYTYDDNATCTSDGTKSAECENCDATDTVTAENTKTDHIYVADVTEATCYDDGIIVYACSCGASYSKTLYATGHIDNDSDNICDECDKIINNDCDCICHSSSRLLNFIWKILSFLNRLFGTNATCECGVAHW